MAQREEPPPKRPRTEDEDAGGEVGSDEEGEGEDSAAIAAQQEGEIGVCCRINPELYRVRAVLRARYSDFMVREVSEEGAVSVLRSTSVPPEAASGDPAATAAASLTPAERLEKGLAALRELGADAEALRAAVRADGSLTDPKGKVALTTAASALTKPQRTAVHAAVRAYFPRLSSTTEDGGISVGAAAADGRRKDERWPKGRPPYLHFTLYKENVETAQCVKTLATRCGVTHKLFSCCGTKDKRAITVQRMCAHRLFAERLAAVNGADCWGAGLARVGDFCYSGQQLRLGMLNGNRFCIILRDAEGGDSLADPRVSAALASCAQRGFANYFGPQRFGTSSIPTWRVATKLLSGDYAAAVGMILESKGQVHKPFAAAAAQYAADPADPAKALALATGSCPVERGVLSALARDPRNAQNAFDALPRNTRMLYFHALQSLVWNRMASARLQLHGTDKAVPGDLVLGAGGGERGQLAAVRVLTEETAPAHSIFDVVMPVPGADPALVWPTHSAGRAAYLALLKEHGAEGLLGGEGSKLNWKLYGLYGAYRKVLQRPEALCWRRRRYAEHGGDLQRGELRDGALGAPSDLASLSAQGDIPASGELPDSGEGPRCALELAFTLPSSTYATMLLREVAVVSTAGPEAR
eukprot:TRINITY_DN24338_c0_g1_i1.p1 TRINITY_DN24338_c0_g1~~TRINITY_DN24338_c0_g1_i1.p1  ORF type:complete len:667 (+),score=245.22 TRINITY_DN24338_c0_g1_i1:77-2002(+)